MALDDQELKEIKDRAEKSHQFTGTSNVPFYVHLKRPRQSLSKHDSEKYDDINFLHYDDGIFIANAKDDVLKLISEIESLKSINNKCGAV